MQYGLTIMATDVFSIASLKCLFTTSTSHYPSSSMTALPSIRMCYPLGMSNDNRGNFAKDFPARALAATR